MKLRALKFIGGPSGGEPVQSELESESIAKPQDLPAAYVVQKQDLKSLRRFKDLIVDRGRKLEAKALSDLLLGYKEKIPLIEGSYTHSGQLRRSVRTLLANALQKEDRNMYIIGTEEGIFDELLEQAEAAFAAKDSAAKTRTARSSLSGSILPGDGSTSSRILLELLPKNDAQKEEELARRYAGESIEVKLVRQLTLLAAQQDEPVLILGDTGTGKELVARAIHNYSARRIGPFTPVNCGAIPTELLESELFGYTRWSHNTAYRDKIGLWKVADKGTLFLDEMGDLRLDHQVKILRAIEEGKIRPIGAEKEIPVDVRVIAATNRDLFSMVQAGQFREDLYYRLRHLPIYTPALQTHPQDIPGLAQSFWQGIVGDKERRLPKEILDELQSYRWPGNVRELKAMLSRLHALFGKDNLDVERLRAVLQLEGQATTPQQGPASLQEISLHRVECLRHLRRVDEVVRACKVAFRPLRDTKTERQTAESVQAAIRYRLNELEMLCLRPLLFHSEVAFSVVYRLKGKLSYFHSLLQTDVKDALRYWKNEVSGELKLVLSTIFQEVERLAGKD
jgi:DNA-binding NtrC family response regulator